MDGGVSLILFGTDQGGHSKKQNKMELGMDSTGGRTGFAVSEICNP